MESPVSMQGDKYSVKTDVKICCETSFSTKLDLGSQFWRMGENRVVVLGTCANANLARLRWLEFRDVLSEKHRLRRVLTYPACARRKFGDERPSQARFAAEITARIAAY